MWSFLWQKSKKTVPFHIKKIPIPDLKIPFPEQFITQADAKITKKLQRELQRGIIERELQRENYREIIDGGEKRFFPYRSGVRIECKKPKTNTIKVKNGFNSRHLDHYLSQEISYQQLEYYYNKTIGTGDYYKLSEAIRIVQEINYTSKTKEKLIEVLRSIGKHRAYGRQEKRVSITLVDLVDIQKIYTIMYNKVKK